MNINIRTMIIATILPLCLATSATADQVCKDVRSHFRLGEITVPNGGDCNVSYKTGFDGCLSGKLRGTLRGVSHSGWNNADIESILGDTATAWLVFEEFVTNKGTINVTHHGMYLNDPVAARGYGAVLLVTGGTGEYENATGWMVRAVDFGDFTDGDGGGRLTGEICFDKANQKINSLKLAD